SVTELYAIADSGQALGRQGSDVRLFADPVGDPASSVLVGGGLFAVEILDIVDGDPSGPGDAILVGASDDVAVMILSGDPSALIRIEAPKSPARAVASDAFGQVI